MVDYFEGDNRTNRERMLAGDLYIADDPDNRRIHFRAVKLADDFHRAAVVDEESARPLLDELLGHLGEDAFINIKYMVPTYERFVF